MRIILEPASTGLGSCNLTPSSLRVRPETHHSLPVTFRIFNSPTRESVQAAGKYKSMIYALAQAHEKQIHRQQIQ